MLVTIICVANPDNTGIDVDRINKVEDLPDEIAQKMLDGGTGRVPSEAELKAYHDARQAVEGDEPYGNGGELPPGLATIANETSNPIIIPTPASSDEGNPA